MAISPDTIRLADSLRIQLDETLDAQTRDLVTAWARAWQEIAPDVQDALEEIIAAAEGDRLTPAALRRSVRLQQALAFIAAQLQALTDQAQIRVVGDLAGIVATAAAAQAPILDSQLPDGVSLDDLQQWARVDEGALSAIVERTTEQITQVLYPLSDEAYAAVQRELVRSVAAGSNPRVAARRMVARSRDGFNGGLNRALVIARTEMLDAHRNAAQAGEEPYADVMTGWEWSASLRPRTCRACLSMHGRRFPLTEPGPMGHQQCVLPGTVLSGPAPVASVTRWFDGEVVDITTLTGRVLSVTPNHPVLTSQGWVLAGFLREGDDVVTGTGADGPAIDRRPHDHQVPSLVEDVAQSLGGSLPVNAVSVPTAPEDFHGDGAGSKVHVVRTNGLLWDDFQTPLAELLRQPNLVIGHMGLEALASSGALDLLVERLGDSSAGGMGSLRVPEVLLGGASGDEESVGVGHPAGLGAAVLEHTCQEVPSHAERAGQRSNGLPGGVALDYVMPSTEDLAVFAGAVSRELVLRTVRRSWSGHVFNFQTGTGWYLANGILTHNCRCARLPVTATWAELGFDYDEPDDLRQSADDYFRGLTEEQQRGILGDKGYDAWMAGEFPIEQWATRRSTPGWRDSYVASPAPSLV